MSGCLTWLPVCSSSRLPVALAAGWNFAVLLLPRPVLFFFQSFVPSFFFDLTPYPCRSVQESEIFRTRYAMLRVSCTSTAGCLWKAERDERVHAVRGLRYSRTIGTIYPTFVCEFQPRQRSGNWISHLASIYSLATSLHSRDDYARVGYDTFQVTLDRCASFPRVYFTVLRLRYGCSSFNQDDTGSPSLGWIGPWFTLVD